MAQVNETLEPAPADRRPDPRHRASRRRVGRRLADQRRAAAARPGRAYRSRRRRYPADQESARLDQRVPPALRGPRSEMYTERSTTCSTTWTCLLEERAETERQLRQFVADASHELRTPLTSIKGYAELARRDGRTLPTTAGGDSPDRGEADRMSTLVEDLAAAGAGWTRDGRCSIEDRRSVRGRGRDFQGLRVSASDHPISVDLPDVPVAIMGTRVVCAVAGNLVANAVRHTPPGHAGERVGHGRAGHRRPHRHRSRPGFPRISSPTPSIGSPGLMTHAPECRGAADSVCRSWLPSVSAHHGTVELRKQSARTSVTVRLDRTS